MASQAVTAPPAYQVLMKQIETMNAADPDSNLLLEQQALKTQAREAKAAKALTKGVLLALDWSLGSKKQVAS